MNVLLSERPKRHALGAEKEPPRKGGDRHKPADSAVGEKACARVAYSAVGENACAHVAHSTITLSTLEKDMSIILLDGFKNKNKKKARISSETGYGTRYRSRLQATQQTAAKTCIETYPNFKQLALSKDGASHCLYFLNVACSDPVSHRQKMPRTLW